VVPFYVAEDDSEQIRGPSGRNIQGVGMSVVSSLQDLLPVESLILEPAQMDAYRRDAADFAPSGRPLAVVLAADTAQVAATLRWAGENRVPVVPRGAGSGLSGGACAIDSAIVLSTNRMTAILDIADDDLYAVTQPGVINGDLGRAVAARGMFYPPDPASFEISSIGGNLATNAGGFRCLKYGVTRDSVLGLQVVLADGSVIRTGARTVKNVVGYDLTSLFVGSEGTLGIITEATLRLRPRPPGQPATFVATFPSLPAVGGAVAAIVRSGLGPSLLELMDQASIGIVENFRPMGLDRTAAALLIGQSDGDDASGAAEAMAALCLRNGAGFAISSTDPAEADMLLEARRLHYHACEAKGRVLSEDIGVPRSRLAELLTGIAHVAAASGLEIATVGHAGDGNMHPAMILPRGDDEAIGAAQRAADQICRLALRLGGTVSGEHGIGTLKREWLGAQLVAPTYAAHRLVKSAFDPLGILNPGKAL
jgi:glycolate oxidase